MSCHSSHAQAVFTSPLRAAHRAKHIYLRGLAALGGGNNCPDPGNEGGVKTTTIQVLQKISANSSLLLGANLRTKTSTVVVWGCSSHRTRIRSILIRWRQLLRCHNTYFERNKERRTANKLIVSCYSTCPSV